VSDGLAGLACRFPKVTQNVHVTPRGRRRTENAPTSLRRKCSGTVALVTHHDDAGSTAKKVAIFARCDSNDNADTPVLFSSNQQTARFSFHVAIGFHRANSMFCGASSAGYNHAKTITAFLQQSRFFTTEISL
jgi:hypothetical protein